MYLKRVLKMIDFLSSWIEGIAIAVILVSIFEMILPKGNLKKYIKVVLGIYVVLSVISPFLNSDKVFSSKFSNSFDEYIENYSNEGLTESSDTSVEEMYIEVFENEITNTIEKEGYFVDNCTVKGIFDPTSDEIGIEAINIIISSKKTSKEDEVTKETENTNSEIEEVNEVKINVNITNNTNSGISNYEEVRESDIKDLKKYLSEYYEIDKEIISIELQ